MVAAAACGGDLGLPPAAFFNVADTVQLFALSGTVISGPSGYDIVAASTSRTESGQPFDLAFELDASDRALIYPSGGLGIQTEAGTRVVETPFEEIEKAPRDGYDIESPIEVAVGTTFVGRSRADATLCGFLGRVPRYGKFRVLAIDRPARTLTLELLVNVNCGYRQLQPGIPTE